MKSLWLVLGWICLLGQGLAEEMITRRYAIPPDALREVAKDPFAPDAENGAMRPAREVLEEVGVEFGEGASVSYVEKTSTLVVRQWVQQHHLIENWIEMVREPGTYLIYTSVYEVAFQGDPFAEVKDWKGSLGEWFDHVFESEKGQTFSFASRMKELSGTLQSQNPGEAGILGVFTDPQFQVLMRAIKESERFEEPSMHHLYVKAGQAGIIEMGDQHYGFVSETDDEKRIIQTEYRLSDPGRVVGEGEEAQDRFSLTTWDGSIVAFLKTDGPDTHRLIFFRQFLMDPGGNPLNPEGVNEEG